jgi:hypothetical protein
MSRPSLPVSVAPTGARRPRRLPRVLFPALIAAFAAACHPAGGSDPLSGAATADSTLIRRDIAVLAADAWEGRGTGTAGNDSAAAYVARRFAVLGLAPAVPATAPGCAGGTAAPSGDCAPSYLQPFTARVLQKQRAGERWEIPTQNVVGILPGTDPALRGEYVVVGAHFDHLGRDTLGALDPDAGAVIRNGADDNASGTAAVLELARLFRRQPAKRSIVFVAFSGEEYGLLGSQAFVERPPVPLAQVAAMVNFDMVGRLDREQLQVFGTGTAQEFPALLDSANVAPKLRLTATGDGFGRSDHASFYAKDLPVLHFFTGTHADYHRASDDAERINAAGEARVVDYAARVIRAIADRPARLTLVKTAPPTTAGGRSGGRGGYFGSIPDMAAGDGNGLRLTGVRPGSPADKAGVKAGDVIVEFGGKPVKDLYEYTDALGAFAPGDTTTVVVVRDGQRLTLSVVMGRRGG